MGQADVDIGIVGAGFAGMYMLHSARGLGLEARVIEAGSGVGGTWHWNRYPGARCDVPSMEYSYSFDEDLQQDWNWTERYATQPEILGYARHVAERFDLERDIVFDTRVMSAHFDDAEGWWSLALDNGESLSCRFVVMATGCLSAAKMAEIAGRDEFKGPIHHTGRWPAEGVDFAGKRVAVIGTGSSAVQSIPLIAEQAAELVVFQRTPTFAVPAHNALLDPRHVAEIKADYAGFRAENRKQSSAFGALVPRHDVSALAVDDETRRAEFDRRWAIGGLTFMGAFNDLILDRESNRTAARYVAERIAEIVDDPEVAATLTPDVVIGCKRLCVDTGYFQTYNRPNVELVDLTATPIESITATGIRTSEIEREFDALVMATGFDAMTGALDRIDIRGRSGVVLRERWAAGPHTYLGLMMADFPNLFTITGPGSPSVLTNMIVAIEQHVEFIRDLVGHMVTTGAGWVEPAESAQDDWVGYVNEVASFTLFESCNSWYLGANVPGKPRVFMPLPGYPTYEAQCDEIAANDYRGFVFT